LPTYFLEPAQLYLFTRKDSVASPVNPELAELRRACRSVARPEFQRAGIKPLQIENICSLLKSESY